MKRPPRACRHGRHRPKLMYDLMSNMPCATVCLRCGKRNAYHKDHHNGITNLAKRWAEWDRRVADVRRIIYKGVRV